MKRTTFSQMHLNKKSHLQTQFNIQTYPLQKKSITSGKHPDDTVKRETGKDLQPTKHAVKRLNGVTLDSRSTRFTFNRDAWAKEKNQYLLKGGAFKRTGKEPVFKGNGKTINFTNEHFDMVTEIVMMKHLRYLEDNIFS